MKIEINKIDLAHDDGEVFGAMNVEDDTCASLYIKSFLITKESIEELYSNLKEAYSIMYPENKES